MKKNLFFVTVITLLSSLSYGEEPTFWLCKAKHDHDRQLRTEFILKLDRNSIYELDDQRFIQSEIHTTDKSRHPEKGIQAKATLTLIRDTGGSSFDVEGSNIRGDQSTLTFFTIGMNDRGSKRVSISAYVNGFPMNGSCKLLNVDR